MQRTFKVQGGMECMVGWDEPIQTFFGQVYAVNDEGERIEDSTSLWVGTRIREILTVDTLVALLKPQVTIPDEIYRELFAIEVD